MSKKKSKPQAVITWTPELLNQLRKHYEIANAEGKIMFVFNGWEFETQYAGRLIQFLDGEFKKGGHNAAG